MSPNKIELLLRLYVLPRPLEHYPHEQIHSQDMRRNFSYFQEQGLTQPGITWLYVLGAEHDEQNLKLIEVLTPKGEDLVKRLCAIEP